MYICLCRGITDSQVRNLGGEGVTSAEALTEKLGIDRDDCCGRCVNGIADLISLAQSGCAQARLAAAASAGMASRRC